MLVLMSSFQDKIKKLVVFKKDSNINLKTLNADLKDMLIKPIKNTKRINWVANKGTYTKWKMDEFIKEVEETKIFKLQLMKNYQRGIIKSIQHIKFTELQFLNLQQNWITNVEPIVYLDAPNLRWLDLKNNEIAEMRAFRKMTNPNFKNLKINLSEFIINFTELNNYNRHSAVIARELLQNHTGNVFSDRINGIFNRRKFFYPIETVSEKEKSKSNKKGKGDNDETE